MHDEAFQFVRRALAKIDPPMSVAEIGSRDVCGPRVRDLFPGTDYVGVDPVAGAGVDVVANGATWQPLSPVDAVVCCEVFEHTPNWPAIVANAFAMLRPGGAAIFTCAGPGRPEHGVNIDDPDQPGYYANVAPAELWAAMNGAGFARIEFEGAQSYAGTDTYGLGWRPRTRAAETLPEYIKAVRL